MRVLKFGGKTLQSVDHINEIALKISKELGPKIIIVSAMGDTTSKLTKLGHSFLNSSQSYHREFDMLLASGERVSAALMAMALQKNGVPSESFTGSQAGVLTKGPHNDARIKEVTPFRINEALEKGLTPVIAGFQGVDPVSKNITTLGLGGSDLTAAAFAHHYNCKVELYKTVGSIFTCDPHLYPKALKVNSIGANFLKLVSAWGAKIIHSKASDYICINQVEASFYSDKTFKEKTSVSKDNKEKTSVSKDNKENIFCIGSIKNLNSITVSALFNVNQKIQFFDDIKSNLSQFNFIQVEHTPVRLSFTLTSFEEKAFIEELHTILAKMIR